MDDKSGMKRQAREASKARTAVRKAAKAVAAEEEKKIKQSEHLVILDKLVSYFIAPDPRTKPDSKRLNPTLGGYINRILSFWLIDLPANVHVVHFLQFWHDFGT